MAENGESDVVSIETMLTAEDKRLRKALATLSPAGRARWRKWLADRLDAMVSDRPARGIPYYLEMGPPCRQCGHPPYRQKHG